MDWTLNSDIEILERIGERVQSKRLEKNIIQKEIAERSGVSLTTVQRLELGKPINTLNLISILRELRMLENLELMFPKQPLSPVLLKKMQGRSRKRASNSNKGQ